uniref:Uncharacterized protein n=1 Tax=Panagrolaimus sp. PS1159 TaxID=55785 RepID=A0AC35FHY0_9BILA
MNFPFISATTKFQYAIIQPGYEKIAVQMVNLSDTLLMVAVAQNLLVGPAQLKYRVVESPFEQVITVKDFQYSPIKKNLVEPIIMEEEGEFMYSSPNYGVLTLVNNILYKKLNTEKYFDPQEHPAAKIVKNFKVLIGDFLAAVTLLKGKLETRMVKVLPFSECENIFDSKKLYTLDRDEQFCTEEVDNRQSYRPLTIPSSLLFGKTQDHGYVLVGIASLTRDGVSVSTFVPFHCNFLFESLKQEICI